MVDGLTGRTGQNEKVILSQGAMLVRIEKRINVKAVPGGVLVEDL